MSKNISFLQLNQKIKLLEEKLFTLEKFEEEANLKAFLLDSATDAVTLFDLEGNFSYVNYATCSIFGYTPKELLQKNIIEFDVHTDKVQEKIKKLMTKGAHYFETEIRCRDGSILPVEVSACIIDANGTPYILSVCRDISERKAAKAAINREREQLFAIFESIDEAIYISDPDTYEILYANKAFVSVFGPAIGQKCHKILQDNDDPCHFCTDNQIFGENAGKTFIWECRNKKNKNWYHCINRAIHWPDGRLVRYEMAIDITKKKKGEEELAQSRKMEAIGTLAAGIAHDFNNILNSIFGYLELLQHYTPEGDKNNDFLQGIALAGTRASEIIKQILIFSRQGEEARETVFLQKTIEEVLKVHFENCSCQDLIKYKIAVDRECCPIKADVAQLHQLCLNLLQNACQAMLPAGGELGIKLSQVEITREKIHRHPELTIGKYARMTVSDTGHGMDKKTIEKIFNPYFTTRTFGEGTGLGLAICHGIVKNYGGAIMVTSTPGQGTTFDVFLPLQEQEKPSPYIKGHAEEKPLVEKGKHILFVDDEKISVDTWRIALELEGFEVTGHADSKKALESFQNTPKTFDIIITDQRMPGLTGTELTKEARRIRPDIPVILSSGWNDTVTEREAKKMGINEVVAKPHKMKDLLNAIHTVFLQSATS